MNIQEHKKILRAQMINMRKALPENIRQQQNLQIYNHLTKWIAAKNPKGVLTYVSFRDEPDTHRIMRFLFSRSVRVAVPKCVVNELCFVEICSLDELSSGTLSILEPNSAAPVQLSDFSVCLVPGLCFSPNGDRLGYGKGFYDRFLSGYTGYTVGISYSSGIVHDLPTDKTDQKIQYIATECGVNRVGG